MIGGSAPGTARAQVLAVVACPVCELVGGPYGSAGEAGYLAERHDTLHHRGRRTAEVSDLSLCESCRRVRPVGEWSDGDGIPFALCNGCLPSRVP